MDFALCFLSSKKSKKKKKILGRDDDIEIIMIVHDPFKATVRFIILATHEFYIFFSTQTIVKMEARTEPQNRNTSTEPPITPVVCFRS